VLGCRICRVRRDPDGTAGCCGYLPFHVGDFRARLQLPRGNAMQGPGVISRARDRLRGRSRRDNGENTNSVEMHNIPDRHSNISFDQFIASDCTLHPESPPSPQPGCSVPRSSYNPFTRKPAAAPPKPRNIPQTGGRFSGAFDKMCGGRYAKEEPLLEGFDDYIRIYGALIPISPGSPCDPTIMNHES
jgi:hypothetical protein